MKAERITMYVVSLFLLMIGVLMIQSCESSKIPDNEIPTLPSKPVTYSLDFFIIGGGKVVAEKQSEIIKGSDVVVKFTPDQGCSLFSVLFNGVRMNDITPSIKEVTYTIKKINENIMLTVNFVETNNILISTVLNNNHWKYISMDIYRENGDFYFNFPLSKEEENRKAYFYYPQGDVKIFNEDGSLYWNSTWSISKNTFQLGGALNTIIELTASRLVFKAIPVIGYDGTYTYAQYVYERNGTIN